MPLHSDDEPCIQDRSWILIISIGASRVLYLKDSKSKKFNVPITHGDIVAMSTQSQSKIKHKILPCPYFQKNPARISLTFRHII